MIFLVGCEGVLDFGVSFSMPNSLTTAPARPVAVRYILECAPSQDGLALRLNDIPPPGGFN